MTLPGDAVRFFLRTVGMPAPMVEVMRLTPAFGKLKPKELEKLLGDKEKLKRVLLAHVVAGKLFAADLSKLRSGDKLPTMVESKSLKLGLNKGQVSVDKAKVVKADVEASNGVIHAIDMVLTT